MIKYLPFLVAVFVLSACGSNPYKSDPKQSEALNAARAGGIASLQLKDVPREKIEQALKREGLDPDTEAAIGLGFASAKYAGLMAATPGISNLLGGTLFALDALFSRKHEPHLRRGNFAWMPISMAKDEEEAQQVMKEILVKAMIETIGDHVRLVTEEVSYDPTLAPSYTKTVYAVEGHPDCVPENENQFCELAITVDEPEVAYTPDFLGKGKSYRWSLHKNSPRFYFFGVVLMEHIRNGAKYVRHVSEHSEVEFRRKVTERLPEWFFVYHPPGKKEKPYPLVLNKGRILYFVEPADPNASIVKASADQGSDHE